MLISKNCKCGELIVGEYDNCAFCWVKQLMKAEKLFKKIFYK